MPSKYVSVLRTCCHHCDGRCGYALARLSKCMLLNFPIPLPPYATSARRLEPTLSAVDCRRVVQMLVQQGEELKTLQARLTERDAALEKSLTENVDLTLKASIGKSHRIMFDDPWIVETQHFRCRGAQPLDRQGQLLLALPGVRRRLQPSLAPPSRVCVCVCALRAGKGLHSLASKG